MTATRQAKIGTWQEEGPERHVASGLAVMVRVASAGIVGVTDGAT